MIKNCHPIDELGEIRKQIGRLKAREREICDRIISEYGSGCHGERYSVTLHRRHSRRLDERLLPPEIRDDTRYYALHEVVSVRTHQTLGPDVTVPEVAVAEGL
ncbi:hypothetical protein [Algicella marina]|uniref:Uncharacterized protein n=1 Tax=Algicella marina TaxID=2683284 RepID=A0A6P1T272_9RHOB|nr:hypothetical protein [Algicella marina]QHQ36828.1 hypothetical protein GO499_17390 [Algicella marina]